MSAAAAPVQVEMRQGDGSVRHALRRLGTYVRRNGSYYSIWAVLTLLYVCSMVAVPKLVGWSIEAAVQGLSRDEVVRRCAMLLGVAVVGAGLRYFSRALVFNAAREVEYEIRDDLFEHLQRLPQSFYNCWRTGDLMSRCVNDLNSVRLLLGPGLLTVVQTPALFLGFLLAMVQQNPMLAGLVLLPYPIFVGIARGFGRGMYSRNLAVQQGLADLSNRVQEALAGVPVVKAYAMEEEQERRFGGESDSLYRRHMKLVWVMGSMPAITGMLPALSMWIVLLVGGPQLQSGGMQISQFFEFAMYIYALTFPTFTMGWSVALVQRGAAAMQRIDEVLSVVPSIRDSQDAVVDHELRGEIEFRDLTFSYYGSGREAALQGVSLRVPVGSTLGVVGPVGSGKSTLASVIPRLYEVPEGQLFLDGVDVNRIPLAKLRASIAMVPQDSFLFSMTLEENIAYGVPDAPRVRLLEAAECAQLTKDVGDLPRGYETMVGERGVMLSGGQRQRTALARALALRPRILILDDTLSAVDAETEEAIQRGLREVFAGRTVVVVANRVSSVRDCDQIAVLEAGRIVERGTHAELMQSRGLYARLSQEQESEQSAVRVRPESRA